MEGWGGGGVGRWRGGEVTGAQSTALVQWWDHFVHNSYSYEQNNSKALLKTK